MTRRGQFTCKARRVYPGSAQEGFVALYGSQAGRPLSEVRRPCGGRLVHATEADALEAARNALQKEVLGP